MNGPLSICIVKYTTAAGQTIPTGVGNIAVVNFGTKAIDTHNAVAVGAGWKFTAPYSMAVSGGAKVMFQATTAWAAGEFALLQIFKNGAVLDTLDYWENHVSTASPLIEDMLGGPFVTRLLKGDTLDVRVAQGSGGDLSLYTSTLYNWFGLVGYPI